MKKAISLLSLASGILVTMPIVALKIGGRYISLFTICFILLSGQLIIYSGSLKIKLEKTSKWLFLWILWSMISSIIGFIYFTVFNSSNPVWAKTAIESLPKLILFLVFFVLWKNYPLGEEANSALTKGLLVGTILNCCWAVIDAIGYYISGVSIGNTIFLQYAIDHNVHFNMVSICSGGLIRASGFNYDPAHIGFLAPILLVYSLHKGRYELVMLSVLATISSASTTSLVASLIVTIICMFTIPRYNRNVVKKKKGSPVIRVLYVMLFAILLMAFVGKFGRYVNVASDLFLNRVSETYINGVGGNLRSVYWKYFVFAFLEESILAFFGSGYGTASYWYIRNDMSSQYLTRNQFPYDPEMSHFAYLLDTGIIGVVLLWKFLIRIVKEFNYSVKNGAQDDVLLIVFATVLAFITSGLFYHYIINAPQILMYIAGATWIDLRYKLGRH